MAVSYRRALAMVKKLDGVTRRDHFGSEAFSANGRIFATYWPDDTVNFMFDLALQEKYTSLDGDGFVAIDNAWGKKGATKAYLQFVEEEDFARALADAYAHSAVKRPRAKAPAKRNPRR